MRNGPSRSGPGLGLERAIFVALAVAGSAVAGRVVRQSPKQITGRLEVTGLQGGRIAWIGEISCRLVPVLGHSIPPVERFSLAQKMKAIRPNVPIVMICVHGDNTFSTKVADARVGSLDGPVVLINAIRRLTQRGEQETPYDEAT